MRRPWSLQTYAYLLLLAVAVPLVLVLLLAQRQQMRYLDEETGDQLLALARIAAADADQWFIETRELLDGLARRPAVRALDSASCDPVFRDSETRSPRWLELSLADRNGRVVCTTGISAPSGDLRDAGTVPPRRAGSGQGYWVEALGTGSPGTPSSVALGVPVRGADDSHIGALVARIDAARFAPSRQWSGGLLPKSTVVFLDRDGRMVARRDAGDMAAVALTGESIAEILHDREGHRRGPTVDGTEVYYGFADVAVAQGRMLVAIPASETDPPVHRALRRNLLWALAILVAALLVVTWVTRLFARPLREVVAVARRVAAGDRAVRAREGGPLELVELARQTNQLQDDLVRSGEALRTSEARYRALFETSNDAILGVDQGSRIVFANDAVERMLGYPPSELIGQDAALLQPPRLRRAFRTGLRQYLDTGVAGGGRATLETRALHKDGREVAVEFTYSQLGTGTDSLIVGILRDVSERRAVMARLRESEARFRALADSAPALIWMADADQGCTYVNRAWTAFTGHPSAQDLGDGWLDSVHPADRIRCREANAAAFAERRGFVIEFRLRRHDGEYRWVLNQGAPRIQGKDTLAGYIGSGVDIHDRVVADQRVRRLTTLYAALSEVNEAILRLHNPAQLFQRVCDIVVRHGLQVANIGMLDPDRRFLRHVAVAGDRWNHFRDSVIATDGSDPSHSIPTMIALRDEAPFVSNNRATDPRTVPLLDPVMARELLSTAAFPLRQQDRVVGVFDVFADEVNFFDAELVGLLELLADDVSFALETLAARANRDRAEGALRQLNATLEERVRERTRSLEIANHELEAFSYSTSHDLRAPLRAISGFTDIVLERHAENLDADALGYLQRVKSAATRMSQLINDLLDLSRISRATFERRATSLTDLAQEIVAELREGSAERVVDVLIAPGMVAQVDPGLVRQLLANLLGNAWKFTGRVKHATIEFGTLVRDGSETYFVRDNGAGFDMEHADKLFAPFQRLHGEREFPGTGIGLALAQRVVTRHGGRIWAEAATGFGATFFFTLPP